MMRAARAHGRLFAVFLGVGLALPLPASGRVQLIPASDADNARHWEGDRDAHPAEDAARGLRFPCAFGQTGADRHYWERSVEVDLGHVTSLYLDLAIDRPSALRSLSLYLKSGDGWYAWHGPPPARPGRHRLHLHRREFAPEGDPAGWDRIDAIRLSPWKGDPLNADLTLYRLSARRDPVLIVEGTTSIPIPAERTTARRVRERISNWLDALAIPHGVIDDEQVSPARLDGIPLLILGYNLELPARMRAAMFQYFRQGGRALVCFSRDRRLAELMGFRLGDFKPSDDPGRWSAIRFEPDRTWHLPEVVYQDSWNIRPAYPDSRSARVIGTWEDRSGRPVGDPAWVAGPRGAWMSHILLAGDDLRKQQMLLGLVGRYVPGVWQPAARHLLETAGAVGPYASFSTAADGVLERAGSVAGVEAIREMVRRARGLRAAASRAYAEGAYTESAEHSWRMHRMMVRAYVRTIPSRPGEWRAVWDHTGAGWIPGRWDKTCRQLHQLGINAILLNGLWPDKAHFDSDAMPPSPLYQRHGDQLAACIDAAQPYGQEVHLWMVVNNLRNAPDELLDALADEDRLLRNAAGEPRTWLNPAHPANVRWIGRALREAATRYDLDGVHLDYIRYPDRDAGYSAFTRKRFEEWRGRRTDWPADVLPGGPAAAAFEQFRADMISLLVRHIREQIREADPDMALSAAVFGKHPSCVAAVGQDWKAWLENGDMDFVCPMNYTEDADRFEQWVRDQTAPPLEPGMIRPGIGVTASSSLLTPDQVARQIAIARRLGTPGFALFDLDRPLREETLPVLRIGPTRPLPSE